MSKEPIKIIQCNHCNDTWICDSGELKIDKKKFEIWYECKFCGESEHIHYTGTFGIIDDVPQKFIEIAKSKEIICTCRQK